MGYFDQIPMIGDNDCSGKASSVRITFEAGHSDHRDRRSFAIKVTLDSEEQARFCLPYEHAQKLLRALAADMRTDLRRLVAALEVAP